MRGLDLLAFSVTLIVFVMTLGGCVTLMIFGFDVTVAVTVTVGVGGGPTAATAVLAIPITANTKALAKTVGKNFSYRLAVLIDHASSLGNILSQHAE